jgi:hypothetical protein
VRGIEDVWLKLAKKIKEGAKKQQDVEQPERAG